MSTFHSSSRTGRWQRCVAKQSCPYGAHRTVPQLAKAGGATITNEHGTAQKVSPVVAGVYTVGTGKRRQTFRKDGTKLSPKEARALKLRARLILAKGAKLAKRKAKQQLAKAGRAAKRQAKRTARGAARSVGRGLDAVFVELIEKPAREIEAELERIWEEIGDEFEQQLAAFDEVWGEWK